MQTSSSTRATIVSAENQTGATIVKATFFFCHYYIVWESNNAGEAQGQSWNESLKCRWIPGGSCGYTSGTKRKPFAALSTPRPCWRWLQLQPSCGSPQCLVRWWCLLLPLHHLHILSPGFPVYFFLFYFFFFFTYCQNFLGLVFDSLAISLSIFFLAFLVWFFTWLLSLLNSLYSSPDRVSI